MKISTRSRYGLRLLMELALRNDDKPVFLHEIAKNQQISEKYLSKLVIPLRGAKLIQSARGAHGGYTLARSPERINLFEVIDCLEGGMNLLECTENERKCARSGDCVARGVWYGLELVMKEYCQGLTLADIVKRTSAASFAEYI